MKFVTLCLLLLSCCLLITGCGTNEVVPAISSGQAAFTIIPINISNNGGRVQNINPNSVVVSLESNSGEIILNEKKISIVSFNSSFLVDPILLEQGDYKLTKFLVLNANEEVIYASPVDGSVLAPFVSNPLSLNFSIDADQVTEIEVEVVNTESIDPEDLGYVSISFKIVPTLDILVSVLKQEFASYRFSNSSLTLSGDSDSLFNQPLGDSINVVKIPTDYDLLTFFVTTDDGRTQEVIISVDSISEYRTTPLTIIIPNEIHLLPSGLYGLVDDNIVILDTLTGASEMVIEIQGFPLDMSPGFLTYNNRDGYFYLIEAREDRTYTLAKISSTGSHEEVGVIALDGIPTVLVEGLDFDEQSGLLYASVNLNGTPDQGDFWSESIVIIDITSAEATYLTELSTNVANVDSDEIVIHNGTYYLADGAPPGANFHKFFTFEMDNIVSGGVTQASLIFETNYLILRMAVTDNYIYIVVGRELFRINLQNPSFMQLVGNTHGTSDFNGKLFSGLTYIQ